MVHAAHTGEGGPGDRRPGRPGGSARFGRTAVASLLLALVPALALAGCGGGAGQEARGAQGGSGASVDGDVVVFAASSLTEAFTRLGHRFESAHPGTHVTFSFEASSTLAQQIVSGAPADVFASADPRTMRQVTAAGATAADPRVFVRNRLEIAVPQGNPGDVRGLADFADPERTIALCAPEVPCGAAARRAFRAAGVTPSADTLEDDVKATLTKVVLGEVDAALVYRTDVRSAGGRVRGLPFPEAAEAVNDYPVAPLADAPNPSAARAFVAYVLTPQAQRVLRGAGFDSP